MMFNMLKRSFSSKKQPVYGYDFGNGDIPTFVRGYKDKNGVVHVVEVKRFY
jgi:hypothetical protein